MIGTGIGTLAPPCKRHVAVGKVVLQHGFAHWRGSEGGLAFAHPPGGPRLIGGGSRAKNDGVLAYGRAGGLGCGRGTLGGGSGVRTDALGESGLNGISGKDWPAGVDLAITADDPHTTKDPDIELALATDAQGGFHGDQVFPGLESGWVITVTDGMATKTHTVRDIAITGVDPTTEIMRGTADPFTTVYAHVDGGAAGYWVTADGTGQWSANFSGDYDITPGTRMRVLQMDEDLDHTFTDWVVPVNPWKLRGFYSPVDMSGVWNTVKGGSTVPLKFEVFNGSTELTDTSVITGITQQKVTCGTGGGIGNPSKVTSTGGTSLRYDTRAGQFIQNWKTPTTPDACYRVTMTTADNSALTALFTLK